MSRTSMDDTRCSLEIVVQMAKFTKKSKISHSQMRQNFLAKCDDRTKWHVLLIKRSTETEFVALAPWLPAVVCELHLRYISIQLLSQWEKSCWMASVVWKREGKCKLVRESDFNERTHKSAIPTPKFGHAPCLWKRAYIFNKKRTEKSGNATQIERLAKYLLNPMQWTNRIHFGRPCNQQGRSTWKAKGTRCN